MVMSNSLNSKVMEKSKWAQTKNGLLSEIEALKAQIAAMQLEVSEAKRGQEMYRNWWNEAKLEARHHEEVNNVLKDHLATLKAVYMPIEEQQ